MCGGRFPGWHCIVVSVPTQCGGVDCLPGSHRLSMPHTVTSFRPEARIAKAGCVKASMTPGSPATRTLFPSVWAAAAALASVLTAARKLKNSWILRRLRGVIVATALKLGR